MPVKVNEEGNLILKSIVSQLKDRGYMLFGTVFSYYSKDLEGYIFCAVEPVPPGIIIPFSELAFGKLILRGKIDSTYVVDGVPEQVVAKAKQNDTKKRHRTKERKIGQVIDQVGVWRRYYNGYTDYHGKVIKLSLDEAASKVGIPKKSLDDYYLQLKLGRLYGFNFNEHKDDNVGVLRAFIKSKRRKESTEPSK